MTPFKYVFLGGAVLATAAAGFFWWPASLEPVQASVDQPTGAALIEKGAYLARAADCEACHTAPGGAPFAGGRPFRLPFGTIYSSNITPDVDSGIGRWSDAEFVRALHHGVGRQGEDLYPAFPYTAYALLSTDDVLAIRAYLATLRPSAAHPPASTLSFPFNQRYTLRAWKLLFLPERRWEPSTDRDARWNRGAYLAEALAHCGECHTPRNFMFATRSDRKFAGAIVDGWKAYNITPDIDTGIGAWSDDEISQYIATGHAARHGGAAGSMAEAIDLSLRHLSPADVSALVSYLRAIPPQRSELAPKADPRPRGLESAGSWKPGSGNEDQAGLRIFEAACASCHGWDGNGRQTDHAALVGARSVNDPSGANVVRAVLEGVSLDAFHGANTMPSFSAAYSDAEIAAISNYVIGHFGGQLGQVTPEQVKAARD